MCRAQNLYIDLRSLQERTVRRDKVALKQGEIGGYCNLDQEALNSETIVKRDLSTWYEVAIKCVLFQIICNTFGILLLVLRVKCASSGGSRKFWWGGFEAQNLKNSDVFTKIESDFSAEIGNSNVF